MKPKHALAHTCYTNNSRLQADAKQASLSFTVEGFPKDAITADKHAFIKWVLESSESNDPDVKASLTNTRGEVSNTIVVSFSSGWHRNKAFQWYVDNYPKRKQQLWWWSQSNNRQLSNPIRIRKTISEDARIRGRYLKAAMACIGDMGRHDIEMRPVWHENSIKTAQSGEPSLVPLQLHKCLLPDFRRLLRSRLCTPTYGKQISLHLQHDWH